MGGGILFASGFLAYRYLSFFFSFSFCLVWKDTNGRQLLSR